MGAGRTDHRRDRGAVGFGGIAEGAADVARVLFFLFLAICLILFLLGMFAYRKIAGSS
jgi:uncharacterized membrane protein YtjA (UPF0391 family)